MVCRNLANLPWGDVKKFGNEANVDHDDDLGIKGFVFCFFLCAHVFFGREKINSKFRNIC